MWLWRRTACCEAFPTFPPMCSTDSLFAAEVLVGQAVGAGSFARFRQAVHLSSIWAAALALAMGLAFWVIGLFLIELMTTTPSVREAAYEFLPWAAMTPVLGVACFQLDGIFIGATRTADMRNMMIVSLAVFLAAWALLTPAFRQSRALGLSHDFLHHARRHAWPALSSTRTRHQRLCRERCRRA